MHLIKLILKTFPYVFIWFQMNAQPHVPPKPTSTSPNDYRAGVEILNNAYKQIQGSKNELVAADYWNFAVAYSKIGYKNDTILQLLKLSKASNKSDFCEIVSSAYTETSFSRSRFYSQLGDQFANLVNECFATEKNPLDGQHKAENFPIAKSKEQGLTLPLRDQVNILKDNDLKHRHQIHRLTLEVGNDHPQVKALWVEQNHLDSLNQEQIKSVFDTYGYPGKSLVGEDLQNTALFVIQHAPLAMQEKYFWLIYEAGKAGELQPMPVLMLIDRIHTGKFGKQVFSTQSRWNSDTKKFEQVPIDTTVDADSIRRDLGITRKK